MVPQHVNAFPAHAARPPLDFAPVALVADDDRVIRELCREVLETEALRVLTASNGQEALAIAEAWVPDVLVTDVTMPGLDGFGLVRALRRPRRPVGRGGARRSRDPDEAVRRRRARDRGPERCAVSRAAAAPERDGRARRLNRGSATESESNPAGARRLRRRSAGQHRPAPAAP